MHSVLEILRKTTDFLASKGVDNPRYNSEVIIGHALTLKRMQLYMQFERLLTESELEKIRPLVRRRSLREPLAYVVGETEFYDLKLKTDKRALIPRPETEELVEHILGSISDKSAPLCILDLGTGSACIALALAAKLPNASVTAVDASDAALSLASENAATTGLAARLTFLKSDWFAQVPPAPLFDIIVSNPPYLTAQESAEALPEVRQHEPQQALVASDEGFADLRKIIAGAPSHLQPGGLLAMETGIAQHQALLPLMKSAGFAEPRSLRDLSGRDRFVSARLA